MLIQLNDLAPETLSWLVFGAGTTPRRCYMLARALHELGANDEAIALCEHGLAAAGEADFTLVAEATEWLNTVKAA